MGEDFSMTKNCQSRPTKVGRLIPLAEPLHDLRSVATGPVSLPGPTHATQFTGRRSRWSDDFGSCTLDVARNVFQEKLL